MQRTCRGYVGFRVLGFLFCSPFNEAYRIWGVILGHPHSATLPREGLQRLFYSSEMDDQMESPGVKWKLRLIRLYFGIGV